MSKITHQLVLRWTPSEEGKPPFTCEYIERPWVDDRQEEVDTDYDSVVHCNEADIQATKERLFKYAEEDLLEKLDETMAYLKALSQLRHKMREEAQCTTSS